MAAVREGNKAVLLIVDVQVGVMQNAWQAPQTIQNMARAVEKARAQDVPVIWVQHQDDELVLGSDEWQWVPELLPADGEARIHKQFNSSFEKTSLDETLARLGATRIVLAGAATNWCIRATAYGALERGYDLTLIKDAHTTETMEFEDVKDQLKEEVNSAILIWTDLLKEFHGSNLSYIYSKGSAIKKWETKIDYVPVISDVDIHYDVNDKNHLFTNKNPRKASLEVSLEYERRFNDRNPDKIHLPRMQVICVDNLGKDVFLVHPLESSVKI